MSQSAEKMLKEVNCEWQIEIENVKESSDRSFGNGSGLHLVATTTSGLKEIQKYFL